MTDTEECVYCTRRWPIEVTSDDNIALCTAHWNRWLARYLLSHEFPPCAAHLIVPNTKGETQ